MRDIWIVLGCVTLMFGFICSRVLVLDEMDQLLDSRGNEVLYSLFEWARVPGSKLILIGIANALDLTVRHLPLLGTSANLMINSPKTASTKGSKSKKSSGTELDCRTVKVVNFAPYERSDIEAILEARLIEIGSQIFDPAAIKFVAAKVAASTGDMRKALNSCKLALDAVEKQQRSVLRSTADDGKSKRFYLRMIISLQLKCLLLIILKLITGFNFTSPKKCCILQEKVNVATVAKVFGPQRDEGPLPLQQKIVLATLLRINKAAPHSKQPKLDGVMSAIPLTTLYDEYRKICTEKEFSWLDRSEIMSVCGMLQDRSLVTVIENMTGAGSSKKFGGMNPKNKTGVMLDPFAVEKVVMSTDMRSVISDA
jgi:cell division control protein 6